MTLREIITSVDRSEGNSDWVSIEDMMQDMSNNYYGYPSQENTRITSYFFSKWYCTDTYVGWRVYFLDEKPVAISHQSGRKCDENFSWMSKEAFDETLSYIKTLYDDENLSPNLVTEEDLDKEWNIGFKVSYGDQLLTQDVLVESTGEKVLVVQKWSSRTGLNEIDKWKEVEVRFSNGEEKILKLDDILVPYSLK